jgi:hypothetical protein
MVYNVNNPKDTMSKNTTSPGNPKELINPAMNPPAKKFTKSSKHDNTPAKF